MVFFQSYGFETILNPRSCCPYTGKETTTYLGNGIKLFKDEYGSERYVMYVNGTAVSALQLMIDSKGVRVANVITVKEHRRKGYAKAIWKAAKGVHPVIYHSNHLSEEGKIFSTHCK